MAAESEFVRPELRFEREFGQFRNWWTRDRRIVGNPLSIYLYLLSHRRDYTITQARAQRDLGLGKDAFLAARRRLESAGYLRAETLRWPAGSIDSVGRRIGGQPRKLVFHVLDPDPQLSVSEAEEEKPVLDGSQRAGIDAAPSRERRRLPLPAALKAVSGDSTFGGKPVSGSPDDGHPDAAEPSPDHPALKKDHPQEDVSREDQTLKRSSSLTAPAAILPGSARIDDVTERLRSLNPKLDRHRLEAQLTRRFSEAGIAIDVATIDLEFASTTILGRARAQVVDPVAFVAAGVEASPYEWLSAPARDSNRSASPVVNARCAASGHLWEAHGWCERCSIQSPWCGQCDSTTRRVRADHGWSACPGCEEILEGLRAPVPARYRG